MSRSVFAALVRKDLYLQRGFMIGMVATGVTAMGIMSLGGGKAMAVGGILFVTANVAGAIFIAAYTLLTERKEQARLFALSLPISGSGYNLSKLASGYLAFGIPWLVLTLLTVGSLLLPGGGERGMVVFALLIQCFVLAQFSVVMAAFFAVTTEAMTGVVIVGVNVLFSLFMMQINQPEVTAPWRGHDIVWTPFAQRLLLAELLVTVAAVTLAILTLSRRRDHL